MIVPKESVETYWTSFNTTQNYLFCEPKRDEAFNVYTAWYQPLGEEVVELYYGDPPLSTFYFLDIKDCQIYHETLKYTDKDIFEMDPKGTFYQECRYFISTLRKSPEPETSGFLSNISKLFQFEH